MKKFLNGLWEYLKDWKNLLAHTLIGVGILLVAFVIPVKPLYRVLLLIVVVGFNLIRMNHSKKVFEQGVNGTNVANKVHPYNHEVIVQMRSVCQVHKPPRTDPGRFFQ